MRNVVLLIVLTQSKWCHYIVPHSFDELLILTECGSIVTINSKTVAGEWFGQQVLDIADLHNKELEFEVTIHHLKLRELAQSVSFISISLRDSK